MMADASAALAQLVCACLAIVAGILTVVGTCESQNAFRNISKMSQSPSSCPLFAEFTTEGGFEFRSKAAACDGVLAVGLASLILGLLVIVQNIGVLIFQQRNMTGAPSWMSDRYIYGACL